MNGPDDAHAAPIRSQRPEETMENGALEDYLAALPLTEAQRARIAALASAGVHEDRCAYRCHRCGAPHEAAPLGADEQHLVDEFLAGRAPSEDATSSATARLRLRKSATRTNPKRTSRIAIEELRAELARSRTRRVAKSARDAFSALFEDHGLGEVTVRGVTKPRGTVLIVQSDSFDALSHGARQDFAWTVLTDKLAPSEFSQIADLLTLDSRGGQSPPPKSSKRRADLR